MNSPTRRKVPGMKLKRDELLLFYLPVTCLFLLSPTVFSPWWKTNLSGPLILVLVISFVFGLLLNRRTASTDNSRSKLEMIRLVIQSELQIGQSPDDLQTVIQQAAGSWTIKVSELAGEGMAFLECERNPAPQSENDYPTGELLVDSGEIWLRDSSLDTKTFQLVDLQAGDPSIRLMFDADQQVRAIVIRPPYGDGVYRFKKSKTGFQLELIPDFFSINESSN